MFKVSGIVNVFESQISVGQCFNRYTWIQNHNDGTIYSFERIFCWIVVPDAHKTILELFFIFPPFCRLMRDAHTSQVEK